MVSVIVALWIFPPVSSTFPLPSKSTLPSKSLRSTVLLTTETPVTPSFSVKVSSWKKGALAFPGSGSINGTLNGDFCVGSDIPSFLVVDCELATRVAVGEIFVKLSIRCNSSAPFLLA